ncbi:hypothetical protein CDAR_198181 [Caerostris darwini]|uniref:Uncharacterized protein n=1 Tax=Caerostris darwini TaxID=1538125 RepID=A0AAV4RIM8_9ARAC|nr:hypothetical protein CDAR_198181 [Caerostris darwini]
MGHFNTFKVLDKFKESRDEGHTLIIGKNYVQAFCSYRKQPTLLQSHYRDGLLLGMRYGKWLLGYRPIRKRIPNDSQEDLETQETGKIVE